MSQARVHQSRSPSRSAANRGGLGGAFGKGTGR
jgi:hypothetical protein